jgi:hypothetical protein
MNKIADSINENFLRCQFESYLNLAKFTCQKKKKSTNTLFCSRKRFILRKIKDFSDFKIAKNPKHL